MQEKNKYAQPNIRRHCKGFEFCHQSPRQSLFTSAKLCNAFWSRPPSKLVISKLDPNPSVIVWQEYFFKAPAFRCKSSLIVNAFSQEGTDFKNKHFCAYVFSDCNKEDSEARDLNCIDHADAIASPKKSETRVFCWNLVSLIASLLSIYPLSSNKENYQAMIAFWAISTRPWRVEKAPRYFVEIHFLHQSP